MAQDQQQGGDGGNGGAGWWLVVVGLVARGAAALYHLATFRSRVEVQLRADMRELRAEYRKDAAALRSRIGELEIDNAALRERVGELTETNRILTATNAALRQQNVDQQRQIDALRSAGARQAAEQVNLRHALKEKINALEAEREALRAGVPSDHLAPLVGPLPLSDPPAADRPKG